MTDQNTPKRKPRGTKPGSIRTVRVRLWWAINEAAELLDQPDPETKLKAISALSVACGAYGNLTKTHALEEEVEALKRELSDVETRLNRPAATPDGSAAQPVN